MPKIYFPSYQISNQCRAALTTLVFLWCLLPKDLELLKNRVHSFWGDPDWLSISLHYYVSSRPEIRRR
jgi:hypothetical protein